MKSQVGLLFILFALIFSCNEAEEPILELEEELEQFERIENSNFNFVNSDVQRIKVVGDRLFYSHKTNPGYIESDGEVVQLCCLNNNNMDFRQAFSSNYIVAADRSLEIFNVYDINEGTSGFLSFTGIVPFENSARINTFHRESNFELNNDHLIASLTVDGVSSIYIFDLTKQFDLFQPVVPSEAIKVEFPNDLPDLGSRFIKVNAFNDGWIASVLTGNTGGSGTYFIQKDGSFERLFALDDLVYSGHAYTSEGQLLLGGEGEIRISENESLDRFYRGLNASTNIRFRLIGDRLVIWNPNLSTLYEVESFKGPEEATLRILNTRGIEFSNVNDIAEFNGRVYLATSQGLFTKSLEGFWDSLPEDEVSSLELDFMEGVQMEKRN